MKTKIIDNKLELVFDFDGVICSLVQPYDHFKYGKPNKKIISLIKSLYEDGHIMRLSTARLCPTFKGEPDYDVISGKVKAGLMKHLSKLEILKCFKEITGYKCYGDVYIDDRALWFNGNNIKFVRETIKKIQRDKIAK